VNACIVPKEVPPVPPPVELIVTAPVALEIVIFVPATILVTPPFEAKDAVPNNEPVILPDTRNYPVT